MSVGQITHDGQPFANVAPSGIATNVIVPGRTIRNAKLKLGGTALTKAMISRILMKANGKPFIDASATQIQKIMSYRGETADAAYLDVAFSDIKMNNRLDRDVGAFDASRGIASITSEVTIAGATAPTLKMILTEMASQALASGEPAPWAGFLSKLLPYPYNVSTGGRLPIQLPFGKENGATIKRIHIEHTGNVTGVTMKQDGMVIHESLKAENEQEAIRYKCVPQLNLYTIDFVLDGDISSALNTRDSRSIELLVDFSAADVGSVLVEFLDPLGNI